MLGFCARRANDRHSNSPRRELIRINIKLPDCVLRYKMKSLGFSTEQKPTKTSSYRSVRRKTMLSRHLFMNEDGGLTLRLEGQLHFHVLLVDVGVGVPSIETDAEEDAALLVVCFHCHE